VTALEEGGMPASYLDSSTCRASLMPAASASFICWVGAKGFFSMPKVRSGSIMARSRSSHGSLCTIRSSP
jgi:hypothetical protein